MLEPDLSIVIPAHNEEGCIESTINSLRSCLSSNEIDFEILVVNDGSTDQTESVLLGLSRSDFRVKCINNEGPNGFGFAIREGLNCFKGKVVAVFMADASDSPEDLVRFFRVIESEKVDCVFGSRWIKGGKVYDYPITKLVLNRAFNSFIMLLFGLRYNDVTNAFKMYRREAIHGLYPLMSHHFNLTVELPLKAIVRGYSFTVVSNSWTNRTTGVSKLKLKEMGSRYLFIVLYCLLEKWLSRDDYHKRENLRKEVVVSGSNVAQVHR